jgi:tetratricopeptide (TPR) repeat protein
MDTKAQSQAAGGKPGPDRVMRLKAMKKLIEDSALDLAMLATERELQANPADSDFLTVKATIYAKLERFDDAYTTLKKAIEIRPGVRELRFELARVAHLRGNEADEVEALTGALPLGETPDKLVIRLIQLRSKRQEFAEALRLADELIKARPHFEPYILKKVGVLGDAGRYEEARELLEPLLDGPSPSNIVVTSWAAVVVEKLRNHAGALAKLEKLVAKGDASWFTYACLGKTLSQIDRLPEAIEYFRKATEIAPNEATNWYDMGVLQRQMGALVDSQFSINRSLELDPTNAGALRVAGYEHKYEYGDPSFKRLNVAMAKVAAQPRNLQVEVHYAAAKAFEDVGELEAAMAYYARAGQIQKELTPWSDTRMRGVFAMLKNVIKPADFEQVRKQATPTNKPVFIVGMPRSGTTLLEQVISSHPDTFGAGELKLGAGIINGLQLGRAKLETVYEGKEATIADGRGMSIPERGKKYLEVIEGIAGPGPKRVVDKMPGNYNWVGVLDAVLPGAYFIHSRRHPVEICLSEYRLFFPDGISFSYDLRDLGRAYRLYHEFMSLWTERMGDKILHVRYEDMVNDFENQAHRIISFLELPWNDSCLKFYENERKVVTASVSQVRKPIYKTSTNRWRKYEPYLKPLLDELGPLVKQYEDELAKSDSERGETASA